MLVEADKTSLLANEKANHTLVERTAQPPLPTNPPPADTVKVKQETAAISPGFEQADENPVTMCRNFARGTCKKGAACIFAHKLILSQLPDVFTFCRNFQNSVCSFPKCKFVHATVFEKENFFRTGNLPPHTLAHLKGVEQAPPPPPQSEEPSAGQPVVYSNAAPNPSLPCVPPAVCVRTETGAEHKIFNIAHSVTSNTTSKRAWNDLVEDYSSTRDLDSGEPPVKRCSGCEASEIRTQLMKIKVEKAAFANKVLKQKIAQLNKKNALRASLFRIWLKPARQQ